MRVLLLKRGCQAHRLKAAQIAETFAFGAVAQVLAGTARLVRPQRVDEQTRLADHALSGGARRLLIMLEPTPQLPRRQRRPGQRRQQALGVLGAGAPTAPPPGWPPSSTAGRRAPPPVPNRGGLTAIAAAG